MFWITSTFAEQITLALRGSTVLKQKAGGHLDGSKAGQTSFLFTNSFPVFVLLLLLLQVTVIVRFLFPLLQKKGTVVM